MKFKFSLILSTVGLLCSSAGAAITYVDAVHGTSGNTFATGGSLAVTTWQTGSSGSTTQWRARAFNFGTVPGVIYEAIASPPTNIPELTTQITGLSNGTTYDIWAFFIDGAGTDAWTISAGLTTGALTTYSNPADSLAGTTSTGVVGVSTLSFTNNPTTNTTGFNWLGVKVGQAVASGGKVDVFIDRNFAGSAANNRVWYDGVGFEAVPEPSTALLGGLGMLVLLRRRRA